METVMQAPGKAKTKVTNIAEDVPVLRSRAERLVAGRALRDSVPRSSHADRTPSAQRLDPIEILEESNQEQCRSATAGCSAVPSRSCAPQPRSWPTISLRLLAQVFGCKPA
jgi:hypothetical protein